MHVMLNPPSVPRYFPRYTCLLKNTPSRAPRS